jgi:peptidoglycan/LPS O-acetylase OafA/YrhL
MVLACCLFIFFSAGYPLGVNDRRNNPARIFLKPLTTCGKYSYCIYVIHPFVFGYVRGFFGPAGAFSRHIIPEAIVDLTLTLLSAIIVWNVFEKRFLSLKDRFKVMPKHSIEPMLPTKDIEAEKASAF